MRKNGILSILALLLFTLSGCMSLRHPLRYPKSEWVCTELGLVYRVESGETVGTDGLPSAINVAFTPENELLLLDAENGELIDRGGFRSNGKQLAAELEKTGSVVFQRK